MEISLPRICCISFSENKELRGHGEHTGRTKKRSSDTPPSAMESDVRRADLHVARVAVIAPPGVVGQKNDDVRPGRLAVSPSSAQKNAASAKYRGQGGQSLHRSLHVLPWSLKHCTLGDHRARSIRASKSVWKFAVVWGAGQSGEKLFLQHFTGNRAAAIGVRGTPVGVVPGTRSAVGQFGFTRVSQQHNSTNVYSHWFKCQQPMFDHTLRTCCCPAPQTSFTSWKCSSIAQRAAAVSTMSRTSADASVQK